MRRFVIRVASLLTLATLFLATPALPPLAALGACVRWIPLREPLGFHLNCDSPRFLDLATHPAGLFGFPGFVWQSRPIYIFLGATLTLPLAYLFPSLDWPLPAPQAASWWAYTLLNLAILLVAVCLFDSLIGAGSRLTVAAFVFGSWLLANGVVKHFVWTPHTQLFNVLVPVVALAACANGLSRPSITTARAARLGLAFGIGSLAYGSFAIACVAFVASLWLRRWMGVDRATVGTVLKQTLVTFGAFALPIIAWWSYVRFLTGRFYSHELQAYREFVWMYDAWTKGPAEFVTVLADNLRFFLPTVGNVLWLPGAVLGVLVALAATSGVSLRRLAYDNRILLIAAAVVFGLTFAFLALLGFYAERLSWALVPPLLVVCVLIGNALEANLGRARRNALRAGMIVMLAVCVTVEVRAPVPPLVPGSPTQAKSARFQPKAPGGAPATPGTKR